MAQMLARSGKYGPLLGLMSCSLRPGSLPSRSGSRHVQGYLAHKKQHPSAGMEQNLSEYLAMSDGKPGHPNFSTPNFTQYTHGARPVYENYLDD